MSAATVRAARRTIEAEDLVALDAEFRKVSEHVETGADALLVFDASDQKNAACEAFRLRYFPRAGRVVAVFGQVFVQSPTGRSNRRIYPAVVR